MTRVAELYTIMTYGLSVSFQVPGQCKVVIVVKHNVLHSVKLLVMDLSSPITNARLVHVKIVDGRPFKGPSYLRIRVSVAEHLHNLSSYSLYRMIEVSAEAWHDILYLI